MCEKFRPILNDYSFKLFYSAFRCVFAFFESKYLKSIYFKLETVALLAPIICDQRKPTATCYAYSIERSVWSSNKKNGESLAIHQISENSTNKREDKTNMFSLTFCFLFLCNDFIIYCRWVARTRYGPVCASVRAYFFFLHITIHIGLFNIFMPGTFAKPNAKIFWFTFNFRQFPFPNHSFK